MADPCRGTLVVHAVPDAECTDPRCDCQTLCHALIIPCTDVDGDCPLCAADRARHRVAA
jgi:hypothetical protein